MGWRESEMREGEGLCHSGVELWVACLTWGHVTFFFVMKMVTRYFITQYMGYSFRYRLFLHTPWLIMNNDDDDNDYCDSLCISLKQRQ